MQSFSTHSHFFSSLKQVEKRLKLETPSPQSAILSPVRLEEGIDTHTESLSCPIYLHQDQSTTSATTNDSILQESDPPQEFLTSSPDFLPTQKNPFQEIHGLNREASNEVESTDLDDIGLLMQLLGLSGTEEEKGLKRVGFGFGCDDRFYGKIVGVKGPKCLKEMQRLDGWIKHFMNGNVGEGERKEPLRLAHLLLAKAAFLSSLEGSDGVEDFVFPSTIDDFLHNDPPED